MSRAAGCVTLALALGVGCAGCAVRRADLSQSGAAVHHGRLTSIVYVNPLPGDPSWEQIGTCIKREATRHDISVREVGPAGGNVNVQEMQNLIAQAVATRAQAIVTWSNVGGAAFDPLFARARTQGTLVATIKSSGVTKNQTFEIGTPAPHISDIQIEAVAKRAGHQYIGIVAQREFPEYLAALRNEVSKHPNVTLEDVQYDNGKFTEDVALANRMLTSHPAINVLINYSGFPGVLTAIREKHLVGKVVAFVSFDFPKAMIGFINEGLIGGVRVPKKCFIGDLVVQKFIDAWAGKAVQRHYADGITVVSGEEFKRLAARGDL